ncbi:MAG: sugar-binding protein [Desulfobacteraceae bacterium]|jgi:endo-1,4-beta-xylanase
MKKVSGKVITIIFALVYSLFYSYTFASAKNADANILLSQFTSSSVQIDGKRESVWETASTSTIKIAMTCDLKTQASGCVTVGKVRSLWDGALLYLLIEVEDPDIFSYGKMPTDNDCLEIYFDLYNDKNAKYLEDDWMAGISRKGRLTGKGDYTERIKDSAVSPIYGGNNIETGYRVEIAVFLGGIPIVNDILIGIDFCINDASSSTGKCKKRIFWNDGHNKGLDDNRRWGSLKLTGYDGTSPKALDTFMLEKNIKKAKKLPGGIWKNEVKVKKALAIGKLGLISKSQTEIDEYNMALEKAFKNLRRKGKYQDPMDLPVIDHLPDPFAFFNGKRVKNIQDWNNRREEIKDLAQYYEYGYMPDPPGSVTAAVNENSIKIYITDNSKTGVITGLLTLPAIEQCGKAGPYPVVVSLDFGIMKPNEIYLRSGYAVLSITYSSVASDNYDHTGAFYTLYPYNVRTGNDAGTLLAWAWGASRGVDALEYLEKNNPDFKGKLDLNKLVVTVFSRCGKAALAAGLFDDRFGVVSPGASGCGGAAVYRYQSFGNVYKWGISPGNEVMPDKIRHQGHNSNEMLARFLSYPRIYETSTHGYGEKLPYDHHEIIAAIAPRAVLITTANDDYTNNAEGDAIGLEGAKPVFRFLNAEKKLGLNIRTSGEPNPWGFGGGHWLSDGQVQNLVDFSNMVFFGTPLSKEQEKVFYSNPYYPAFEKHYGGIKSMMPWIKKVPEVNN